MGSKRPCLFLHDLEYTSNNVGRGGWMGTCVIAADTLNEGYQSMEVWQGGRARMSERREEMKSVGEQKRSTRDWIKKDEPQEKGTSVSIIVFQKRTLGSLSVCFFISVTPLVGRAGLVVMGWWDRTGEPPGNWDPNLLYRNERALTSLTPLEGDRWRQGAPHLRWGKGGEGGRIRLEDRMRVHLRASFGTVTPRICVNVVVDMCVYLSVCIHVYTCGSLHTSNMGRRVRVLCVRLCVAHSS